MEELAESALKGILRLMGTGVRILVWLIWDLWFEIIAWYVGWPICRIISFGSAPREAIHQHEQAPGLTAFTVSLVGILALIAAATFIAKLTGVGWQLS